MGGRATINAIFDAIALEKLVADASLCYLVKRAVFSQLNQFMNCSEFAFAKIID